ncbi:MAG: copper resistance protein NlpE N-terminal domain-containing protein [Desulfobacterales bacterium]
MKRSSSFRRSGRCPKRPKLSYLLPALIISLLAGCAGVPSESTPPSETAVEAPPPEQPVSTYTGVIPCADCEGIRMTLSLREDRLFLFRQTYLGVPDGRPRDFYEMGRWETSGDGGRIRLHAVDGEPRLFAVKGEGTLGMLNREGQEIVSGLYDLTRSDSDNVFGDHFPMRGLFANMAGAAVFTECMTRQNFPVVMDGDYPALEAAYLQARGTSGEPLMVTFEGHFLRRQKADGSGWEEAVAIDGFDGVWPAERCESTP